MIFLEIFFTHFRLQKYRVNFFSMNNLYINTYTSDSDRERKNKIITILLNESVPFYNIFPTPGYCCATNINILHSPYLFWDVFDSRKQRPKKQHRHQKIILHIMAIFWPKKRPKKEQGL